MMFSWYSNSVRVVVIPIVPDEFIYIQCAAFAVKTEAVCQAVQVIRFPFINPEPALRRVS